MIASSVTVRGNSMWFFKRKSSREEELKKKEAEIQEVKLDALKRTTEASVKMEMLHRLLQSSKGDATLRLFLATGGDKRLGK